MPIQVACPACGAGAVLPDQAAGRMAKCKRCQSTFQVPESLSSVAVTNNLEGHVAPTQHPGNRRVLSPNTQLAEQESVRQNSLDEAERERDWIARIKRKISRSNFRQHLLLGTCAVIILIVWRINKESTGNVLSNQPSSAGSEIDPRSQAEPPGPLFRPGLNAEPPEPLELVFPSAGNFAHDSKIHVSDSKFEDFVSYLYGSYYCSDQHLPLWASFSCSKSTIPSPPGTVNISFSSDSKEWRYLKRRNLVFIIDGEIYRIGELDHEGKVTARGVSEWMRTNLSIDIFAKLVAAKAVECSVGGNEFILTNRTLEGLRDLASRLPEGVTEDGKYRIRHGRSE